MSRLLAEAEVPTVDSKGKPLAVGTRVRFLSDNTTPKEGTGVVSKIDTYHGIFVKTDKPHAVIGRNGYFTEPRREVYFTSAWSPKQKAYSAGYEADNGRVEKVFVL
jgi:hypothetical protein